MRHGEDNRRKCTDNPAGHHPIQTIDAPPLSSPNFMLDALPIATLPIYPGLGHTWRLGCPKFNSAIKIKVHKNVPLCPFSTFQKIQKYIENISAATPLNSGEKTAL